MPTRSLPIHALIQHSEGTAFAGAAEALLEGCLESDTPVNLLVGPHCRLIDDITRIGTIDIIRDTVRQHDLRIIKTEDVTRALSLSLSTTPAGSHAVVVVPAGAFLTAFDFLDQVGAIDDVGSRVSLIIEQSDDARTWTSPFSWLRQFDWPVIVPGDVESLRNSIEQSTHLSRASKSPCAVMVHPSILRSFDTLACHPHRVVSSLELDAMLKRRRRRRFRASGGESTLRVARRLELNHASNLPSPGEREDIGILTIGPCGPVLRHVLRVFDLVGRVPVLDLRLVSPIDEALLGRMLNRCRDVIVLEANPGEFEMPLLTAEHALRQRSTEPFGSLWIRGLPSDERDATEVLAAGDALRSSVLARKLVRILHSLRPTRQIAARLLDTPWPAFPSVSGWPTRSSGPDARERLASMLADVSRWALNVSEEDHESYRPTHVIDGPTVRRGSRNVRAEIWSASRFLRYGRATVQQVARDDENWLVLVYASYASEATEVEQYATASIPSAQFRRVRVVKSSIDQLMALRNEMREATMRDGATILVIDADPIKLIGFEEEVETDRDVDAQGFSRRDRIVQSADEPCNIRRSESLGDTTTMRVERSTGEGTTYSVDRLPRRLRGQVRVRVRPLFETIDVRRTRPPIVSLLSNRPARFPPPQILHGDQPTWRVHVAGVRGRALGLAGLLLAYSARAQGYRVRALYQDDVRTDDARWCQVLFTGETDQPDRYEIATAIPYGEADLLLGIDPLLTLESCSVGRLLQVSHPSRTACIVDTGEFSQLSDERRMDMRRVFQEHLATCTMDDRREVNNFSEAARAMFGTTRVVDLVMAGAAYQSGYIPLKHESIETGLATLEQLGYGRVREAFRLGRLLTLDPELLDRLHRGDVVDIAKEVRRSTLFMHLEGGRYRRVASDYKRVLEETVDAMPGLEESESGRLALRDLVRAMERCVRWGGISIARRYAELVRRLYEHDRGDRGRALTRHAILPLASAMLVRDAGYLGEMSMSLEARRLARQRLNFKASRGDEMSRRFLNRFEVVALGYRLRVDFRSSDWTAYFASWTGRLRPNPWRGTATDRKRREYIVGLIERATVGASYEYERWDAVLRELYELAQRGQLRHFSERALRFLVEPEGVMFENADDLDAEIEPDNSEGQDETGIRIAQG